MDPTFKHLETATFAGGCFWCSESDFVKLSGVVEAISGYTGGSKANPTYQEVSSGSTGHYEAVQVLYDPEKVTYQELLDASRNAQVYCVNRGSPEMGSTIVGNSNGSKTVTFRCNAS